MVYFAYGSNMSSSRLRERTPSARFFAVGRLRGHSLRFHKHGRDGSAKCDALPTGGAADEVIGVLFVIDDREKPALDAAEGAPVHYREVTVRIVTNAGEIEAVTYVAQPELIDPTLRPRAWYRATVLEGAREHGLPDDYVGRIAAVEICDDPDSEPAAPGAGR